MKLNLKYSVTALASLAMLSACEPEIERDLSNYKEASGDADFSTYVALGNSLTAGVMDDKLNRFGQVNSYPAIIADKMASVVPDFTFRQPLLPEGIQNGTLRFEGLTTGAQPSPIIRPSSGGLSQAEITNDRISGQFNNLGIPGARVKDLTIPGYSNFYFQRFASSENSTLVEEALELNPTFFTLWIGNNDVLAYATDGGHFLDREGKLQGRSITPVEEFEAAYSEIITKLKAGNPAIEGALGNIPNIGSIAYFNVVPWNAFGLSQAQATALNAAFKAGIESPVRQAVILGVITEGARRQIIPSVAEAVVKKQVFDAAREGGASVEQAQQQADDYVKTDDGKAAIAGLTTNLINNRQPAAAHSIVEQQLASPQVTETINSRLQAAIEADNDPERDIAEVLGDQGAAAVNMNFTSQIAILKGAKYYPTFVEGANGFVVQSETSPTGLIQLTENGRMLLTFLSRTSEEFDPENQRVVVPDYYALDQEEAALVNAAIDGYNAAIAEIASENTFALVDINSYLAQITAGGLTEDGILFRRDFITGNTFSLDGVHLTQRGYALVAKKFIQAINSYYNSNIPLPNVSNYPAVGLPAPAN